MRLVTTVRTALAIAFERRSAYVLALLSGLGMLALLVWNSGGLNYYASTGWEFYGEPIEIALLLALSALFGLLVPLQVAAIAKARAALGAAGGLAGTLVAIAGVSCCAPLLLPAMLSFLGFSGTALLGFNASVRGLAGPLTLASLMLMVTSIVLVSRTLAAACALPPRPPADPSGPERELARQRVTDANGNRVRADRGRGRG
jgi:hypothetical protein